MLLWLPPLMLWLLDESFNKKSSQTNNCCFYWSSSGSRRPRVPVCCRVRQPTPSGPRLLPSQAADALGSPSTAESGSGRPRVSASCRVRRPPPGIRQRRLFGELLSQVTRTARNLITNLIKFRKTRILLIAVRVDYTSRPGSLKSECYQLPFV